MARRLRVNDLVELPSAERAEHSSDVTMRAGANDIESIWERGGNGSGAF
jgi:hypothetical protein